MVPESRYLPLTPDLSICRIVNGMWQVSGGHGHIDPTVALQSMVDYVDAGFTTWDLADHYGPAEDWMGALRRYLQLSRGADATRIQALTKWVPHPGRMTRQVVEDQVDSALRRMAVPRLDLLQFHWWDYRDPNYLDALQHLADLQQEGKIQHLALTNFDTEHLDIVLKQGIKIVANQVQYSVVDRRPMVTMANFCQQHGIRLLAYGSVCGGLLSERFLGAPEPDYQELSTASQRKYKPMIDAWGGWSLFQQLLQRLAAIAHKHQVGIANVAIRYVLEQPMVAGVIVGCRLGLAEHRADNARVFGFALDAEDYDVLDGVLRQARNLFHIIGDCGDEYRR